MVKSRFTTTIAYVSIYSETVDGAVENLVRLITGRECGVDEGEAAWHEALGQILDSGGDLEPLNELGADFSAAQWRQILERVHAALEGQSDQPH